MVKRKVLSGGFVIPSEVVAYIGGIRVSEKNGLIDFESAEFGSHFPANPANIAAVANDRANAHSQQIHPSPFKKNLHIIKPLYYKGFFIYFGLITILKF